VNPAPWGSSSDSYASVQACKAATPLCPHPPVVTQPSRRNGQLHQQVCHRCQAHSEALLDQEGEWAALIMLNYTYISRRGRLSTPTRCSSEGLGLFSCDWSCRVGFSSYTRAFACNYICACYRGVFGLCPSAGSSRSTQSPHNSSQILGAPSPAERFCPAIGCPTPAHRFPWQPRCRQQSARTS
jgi:hypothetical protein